MRVRACVRALRACMCVYAVCICMCVCKQNFFDIK